jgi:hypothetical protein
MHRSVMSDTNPLAYSKEKHYTQGLSIACSTPEAIAWDESWANTHEISGRAMKAVHDSGSDFNLADKGAPIPNGMPNGFHTAVA